MEAGRQPATRLVGGALERTEAHGDHRAQLRLRTAHALAQGSQGKIPADRSGRRGRGAVRAQRRLRRALQPDHGLCQGRARRGRANRRERAGHRLRGAWAAHQPRADRPGCDRLRDRGQCRRHLGARRGEDGGHRGAGRRGRASIRDYREKQGDPARPADAARSRPHFLSQARARRAGDRRLGKGYADLRVDRRTVLFRA